MNRDIATCCFQQGRMTWTVTLRVPYEALWIFGDFTEAALPQRSVPRSMNERVPDGRLSSDVGEISLSLATGLDLRRRAGFGS
jgi:hypothetical protein